MDRDACARVIRRIRDMESGTSLMEQAEFLRSQIARYQGDRVAAGLDDLPDTTKSVFVILNGILAAPRSGDTVSRNVALAMEYVREVTRATTEQENVPYSVTAADEADGQ